MAQGIRKPRHHAAGPMNALTLQHQAMCLRTTALMVAAAFGAVTSVAFANPQGAKVVSGSAAITSSGSTLVIKNTPGAIINWQSFSIGAGETTNFIQQSVNSAVLNRVIGVDPSLILGTLTSNGRVYLVNPNGVVFGKGAIVDAAGLVVSSLDITDQDFKNGTLRFVGSDASGSISVAGVLRSTDGDVYLIAPNVTNAGSITAVNGNVTLAAGQDVEILGSGLTDIQFNVQNKSNSAVNLGQINGDAVGIFAGTITQAGGVNATTATVQGGKVILSALGDVSLAAGSSTSADSASGTGGSVAVQSVGGNISVASGAGVFASGASGGSIMLLASGGADTVTGQLAASGTLGLGGSVEVLGSSVGLNSGASVDASGATGGGQILIGGAPKQSVVMNASSTSIAAGAMITADATEIGNGGHVVAYSSNDTSMMGSIAALGGTAGGNGGMVETSGESINVLGSVSAAARSSTGKPGEWLLDPSNITVDNLTGAVNYPGVGSDVSAISVANALDAGTSVTIATASVAGAVTSAFLDVNAPINATAVQNNAQLTLQAGGAINISAAITGIAQISGSGSPLTLNMTANLDGSGGGINISAPVFLPRGTLNASGATFSNIAGNTITVSTLNVSASGAVANAGLVDASALTNGGANGGNVSIVSQGSISTGTINANSNGGTTGGQIVAEAATGLVLTGNLSVSDNATGTTAPGQPGQISVSTASGTLTSIGTPTLSANGASTLVGAGAGGSINILSEGGAQIDLSGVAIVATGGSALAPGAGAGGLGGTIGISGEGGMTLTGLSLNVNGGQGAAGIAAIGSDGGNGGQIELYSNEASTFSGLTITGNGGNGGNGDSATGGNFSYSGGDGGSGGAVYFQESVGSAGLSFAVSNSSVTLNGGVGGNGGTYIGTSSAQQADAGNGGVGGAGGYVAMNGSGGISLSGVTLIANGGAGGLGGQVTGSDQIAVGGTGGQGGASGYISISQTGGNISVAGSTLTVIGGAGGAAQVSSAGIGAGGDGGAGGSSYENNYPIYLNASSGSVTIDGASHFTVSGGAGGAGATGFLTNIATTGYSIVGGAGGAGGNASGIQIYGNTGVAMGGTIIVQGGAGGAGGVTGGTNGNSGEGLSSGNGGLGGSVGLGNSALSLGSLGSLTDSATISIIGGAGGAGARSGDTNVVPGNGGQGGDVDNITISAATGVAISGALTIASGAGGNTTGNGSFVGTAGSGGFVDQLEIMAPSGALTISAPVTINSGLPGIATSGGLAGNLGDVEAVQLIAAGNINEGGSGAFLTNTTGLFVNATGFGVDLGGNNQISNIEGMASSTNFVTKSIVNMTASGFDVPGNIQLIATGSGSGLEVDGDLTTSAGAISLSGQAGVSIFGNINSGNAVSITGGTLALNGGDVNAVTNINISVAGSLSPGAGVLSAAGYYLNSAGDVGSAATPIELQPAGFSATLGGTAGGGFYVTSTGSLQILAGSGQGIVAGSTILIDSQDVLNTGTIRGGNITLNGTGSVFNEGTVAARGALVMTAQAVSSSGSISGESISINGSDNIFLSGKVAAVGNLALASSAISIGFNGHSTAVSAANISMSGGTLMVGPDINGSAGDATGGGTPLVSISAAGTLTVTLSGDANLMAGSEKGSYVSIISGGNSTYNIGGNLNLTGGSGVGAYTLLDPTKPGSNMDITAKNITLQGGSADGAYAAIQSFNNIVLNAPNGAITLNHGSATDADGVVVAGTAGTVTINSPSCINCVQKVGPQPIGDGSTEAGIYTVMAAAAPVPLPNNEQQALDNFVNDIITLLDGPLTQSDPTAESGEIEVDGTTDGCI